MRALALLAVPLLALAGPAHAAGWSCSVREQIDPNLNAAMDISLGPDRGRTMLEFYINWVERPGFVGGQSMSWLAIPHDATLLWKPDGIGFTIPGARRGRNGLLLFRRPGQRLSLGANEVARDMGRGVDMTGVTLTDPRFIAQLWPQLDSWHVDHSDRHSRVVGRVDLRLPGAADAQALFTRLRAALERKAADPEANCDAIPDREPRDEDII